MDPINMAQRKHHERGLFTMPIFSVIGVVQLTNHNNSDRLVEQNGQFVKPIIITMDAMYTRNMDDFCSTMASVNKKHYFLKTVNNVIILMFL